MNILDAQIAYRVLNRMIGDPTKWHRGLTSQQVGRQIRARDRWRDNMNT